MSKVVDAVMLANAEYVANFGDKGALPSSPRRQFAILTCMDARLDPAQYAGLSEGDAHVIRNAGGRASDDAIRSLVISYKLLGAKEWFVIHHTDCGMSKIDNKTMNDLFSRGGGGSRESSGQEGQKLSESHRHIDWLTMSNPKESLLEDVQKIRNHSMVPSSIPIYGFIYDCKTGRLIEISEATKAGKAR